MDKETEVWFAMRATYRRELEAMHLLEKANLGCFIPMQYKISIRRAGKSVLWFPSSVTWFLSMHVLPKYSDLNLKLLICNISPIPVAVGK